MCTAFDPRQYQQVQVAYRLLGKSQVSKQAKHVHMCIHPSICTRVHTPPMETLNRNQMLSVLTVRIFSSGGLTVWNSLLY